MLTAAAVSIMFYESQSSYTSVFVVVALILLFGRKAEAWVLSVIIMIHLSGVVKTGSD